MGEGQVKIAVSSEAAVVLAGMVKTVNEGFTGGHVRQRDLASWAIMHVAGGVIEKHVEAIRAAHFDEVAYVASVLKDLRSARQAGGPTDVRAMLATLVSATERSGRSARSRRASSLAPGQESTSNLGGKDGQ